MRIYVARLTKLCQLLKQQFLYFRGTQFKSLTLHRLFGLKCFVIVLSHSWQM